MVTTRHVSCPCQALSDKLDKKAQELEASCMRREARECCSMLLLNTAFGRFYQDLSSKIYHQDLSQEYRNRLEETARVLQDRASDMPSQAMFFLIVVLQFLQDLKWIKMQKKMKKRQERQEKKAKQAKKDKKKKDTSKKAGRDPKKRADLLV